jgi:hypothetical protein
LDFQPADRHRRSTLELNAFVFLDLNELRVGRRCRKCACVTLETKNPAGIFPDRAQFQTSYFAFSIAPSIRQRSIRAEWESRIHSDQNILRCDQQA